MEDQFGGRTDDDLFADDFEPVPEAQTVPVPISPLPTPLPTPTPPAQAQAASAPSVSPPAVQQQKTQATDTHASTPSAADSSNHRPRHGGHKPAPAEPSTPRTINRSMLNSRHAPKDQVRKQREQETRKDELQGRQRRHGKKPAHEAAGSGNAPSVGSAPEQPGPGEPAAPKSNSGKTAPANKADPLARLASGGAPRAKLTEEELTVKMEKMRLLNQERERRHEAVEKDEKAHAEALARSEEEARKRRTEEAEKRRRGEEERRKLEEEREKNRARKLKAMGMKEGGWDEGKDELMREMEGPRRAFRGAHGGIRGSRGAGLAGSRFATTPASSNNVEEDLAGAPERDFAPRGRGRGRGGRGRGRGRGGFDRNGERESGHHENVHRQNGEAATQAQQPSKEENPQLGPEDFPALPSAPKPDDAAKPAIAKFAPFGPLSPLSPLGKWDDEMEALDAAAAVGS